MMQELPLRKLFVEFTNMVNYNRYKESNKGGTFKISPSKRDILNTIEKLRNELEQLLKTKETIEQEIMAASKRLDIALNEYYRLLRHKDN